MGYWVVYAIILASGLTLGIGLIFLVRRYLKISSSASQLAQNIMLSLLTIFLTLMVAEIFFKVAFAQSDAWNQTLASQNWFKRYWNLNSMGYRDVEWSEEDIRTKRKVLVLGDSFAAGQGIENIEDRFSNILGTKLGDDYLIMNIATVALSTKEEIDRVQNFSYKPEILILQYFINDIRYVAHKRGIISNVQIVEPWPIFKPLVDNSYVINFIYWRIVRMLPRAWQADDFVWIKMAYDDPDVWWLHQQELQTIYQGALSEEVKLVVAVFPSMADVEQSREITNKVVDFFEAREVPVLDVAALIENTPKKQLVASPLDAHPSEWVHSQVANKLYEIVISLE